jgi:PAS domain-containing protein
MRRARSAGQTPDILARIRRGERVDHYETVRRRKDGGIIHVSLTVSPVCNQAGVVTGASRIACDITDRKLIQQKLIESEQFARSVLESSHDCIQVLSMEGELLSMKSRGQEVPGIDNF